MSVDWFPSKAMPLLESGHRSDPNEYGPDPPSPVLGKKCWHNRGVGRCSSLLSWRYVYLRNTWVCSPLCRSAWLQPSSARLCRALSPARQPEGKQCWRFLSKRAVEKKESRLPRLSGRSNKVLSTAVRTTQGDLPDSISSTLFSVPKAKQLTRQNLAANACTSPALHRGPSCKVLSTPEQMPRNLFCPDSKMHWKVLFAVKGAQNALLFPSPLFSLPLCGVCISCTYIFYGGCLSAVPCHPPKAKH